MRSALFKSLRSVVPRVATRTTQRAAAAEAATSLGSILKSRAFASTSAGNVLSAMTKENPHVDVVRYMHKNRKWSLNHVDYYSEALAIGFLENGLKPGDRLLCYLPLHFSETVRIRICGNTISNDLGVRVCCLFVCRHTLVSFQGNE